MIFTPGCNLRCPYCHNPELLDMEVDNSIWFEHIKRIEKNPLIDAVVITGGEPTLHHMLLNVIPMIRDMGIPVKLDTNGLGRYFCQLIKLADYVAMDIKSDRLGYARYLSVPPKMVTELFSKRMDNLVKYANDFEFRITCAYPLINFDAIINIGEHLEKLKKKHKRDIRVFLQQVRLENVLNPDGFTPIAVEDIYDYAEVLESFGLDVSCRVEGN